MKKNVSIIIPAYNEEKGIGDVLRTIKKHMSESGHIYEIIVIDDHSNDGTAEAAKGISGVRIIRHTRNMGYGSSLKTGLKEAKNEWVMITDADGTYPNEEMPNLLKHAGEYDMVVGARKGSHVHIPLTRRPAKWMLGKMANFVAGKKVEDINSGLRVFRKDLAMRFFNLYPPGFSFTSTITLAAMCNGYKVKYIPINYMKRVGKSTMKASDFFGFVNLMIKIMVNFKPLKVFLLPSILLFISGMMYGIYQAYFFSNLSELSLMLVLSGLQIGFLGVIADMINASRDW